ncbi:MAG: hypothetical protein ABSF32_11405 [Ignavibacteria bacterium]|jgi:hypothetical protein
MESLIKKIYPFKFLPARIYIYYFLSSFTLISIYFNKYIKDDNLYGRAELYGESGIKAVLNFQAILPVQYRILIPYIFKFFSLFIPISGNYLLYIILTLVSFFTLIAFYYLLNEYFIDKTINAWISPIIFYPLIRHLLFNDLWEYYDTTTLLFLTLGFLCIVKEKHNWLLLVYVIGFLNKDSVAYLAMAFAIYNFKNILKIKYLAYFIGMVILYFGIKMIMVKTLISSHYNALEQNVGMFDSGILGALRLNLLQLQGKSEIIRLTFLSFGGMHLFILALLLKNKWKQFKSKLFYVNLVVIPYFLTAPFLFLLTDWRDYIEIIPFITILFLIASSTLEKSFLQPVDRLYSKNIISTQNNT